MNPRIAATIFAMLMAPATLSAQGTSPSATITEQPAAESNAPSLRERLMPAGPLVVANATVPVLLKDETRDRKVIEPAMSGNRSGVPYMIAGGALFLAGILIDNNASTVLELAGAGIGAYGLYLYFR